jgi:hypothetical protein
MLSLTTSTYTTTVSVYRQNVTLAGACKVVSYVLPDTEEAFFTNVTSTNGNTTMYSLSEYSVSTATVETLNISTYTTTTFANNPTTYTLTSTSVNSGAIPSSAWSVTVCVLSP